MTWGCDATTWNSWTKIVNTVKSLLNSKVQVNMLRCLFINTINTNLLFCEFVYKYN